MARFISGSHIQLPTGGQSRHRDIILLRGIRFENEFQVEYNTMHMWLLFVSRTRTSTITLKTKEMYAAEGMGH